MATAPVRTLKPLILVLGGIREVGHMRRQFKQETHSQIMPSSGELRVDRRDRSYIERPEEYRWARRFVVNAHKWLSAFYVRTPIGNVALRSQRHVLHAFREKAMHEAALRNPARGKWQVVVELAWEDLDQDGDAISQLLTLKSDDLPELFFNASAAALPGRSREAIVGEIERRARLAEESEAALQRRMDRMFARASHARDEARP